MPWLERPAKRSLCCNGDLVRFFRDRCQWTQEELAHWAGVSVRVVAKAEAGGALYVDTIELLAAALNQGCHPVAPEDLVCDPRALALRFFHSYALHERQLVAKCHGFLDERIVACMAGDPAEIPFSGLFQGIDGMDRLWGTFFRTVHRPNKVMAAKPELLVVEGNQAISLAREIADLPGMPSMGPQTIVTHLRFERGKIVHFETHFDTLAASRQIQAWRGLRGG